MNNLTEQLKQIKHLYWITAVPKDNLCCVECRLQTLLEFIEFVKKHGKKVIVVEDHYREGGIGEMISEVVAESKEKIEMKHLAISEIPHSGKPEELLRKYGIDSKAIVNAVKNW